MNGRKVLFGSAKQTLTPLVKGTDRPRSKPEVGDHRLHAALAHYLKLRGALGPTIAGGLAGVGKAGISHWSPSIEEEQRIAMAASVWVTVSRADDDDTARGWFVGLNPWLSGESPVDALMSGRLQDVRTAATAFKQDTFSG